MRSVTLELADVAVIIIGLLLLVGITYRQIWRISRAYPARPGERISDCGFYAYSEWFGFNGTRIGVSSDGMEVKQAVIPKLLYVTAFVPWSEIWVRTRGHHVWLSFTDVPETELRYNKVLVAAMQHQLRRKVPFGHVT